jgi:hypothetical protein
MGLYPVAVCYNEIQDNTIQYNNTTHKIPHKSQDNSLYSKLQKKKKKILQGILYFIKTQKRVGPRVGESVFKTTRYIKQSVNHTTFYSTISHISPTPTPHCTSLHIFTLHIPPRLNSVPFTAFSWFSHHFNPLNFTSLHLPLSQASS